MINTTYTARWETIRLASLFSENGAKNSDSQYSNAYQFFYGNIVPKKSHELTDGLIETYRKYTVVQPDDIMINGLNLNYDFITQRVASVKETGIITSAYICIRPVKENNAHYYTYLLKSLDARKVFHGMGTGIRLTLSWNSIKNLRLPLPPRAEQDQIVRFLDWKTSKINGLIIRIRKNISVLTEARGSILYDYVTKGIFKGEYKESGDLIIGLVPASWKVCKLKYLTKIYTGNSISDDEKNNYMVKTDVPYVATKDVDLLSHSADYENGLYVPPDSSFKIAPPGCTLVCIEGGSAGRKKAYITRYVAFVNKLCAFVPTKINGRFLFHYLCSPAFTEQFYKSITGLIGGVSINTIKRLLIPLPPESEQEMIAKQLDEKCERIDEQIYNLSKKIELLIEYKNRIISDVAMGQVDVRDAEIPEYERVEDSGEPELEDIDELEETDEPEEAKSEV